MVNRCLTLVSPVQLDESVNKAMMNTSRDEFFVRRTRWGEVLLHMFAFEPQGNPPLGLSDHGKDPFVCCQSKRM
jgi:hypothetical protein